MAIFLNTFLKTLAIFLSITFIVILSSLALNLANNKGDENFIFVSGDENSPNSLAIIELNGIIIEKNIEFPNLAKNFIISPKQVKGYLDELVGIAPKIIIFSINSPGGTVSASKNLYDIIAKYKKNNDVEILVHTNELLASGGYWVSTSADEIYASYGSIVGSIGVKGPDWFYYDQPKSISTGIFGNRIETINGIKVFSNKAGKSKDIFNPFREPTKQEIKHLQNMVDEIYSDFVQLVSKNRKIEINTIINDIGGQIFTSKQALKSHLIDGEISLDELVKRTIKNNNFENYKIIKKNNQEIFLIKEIFSSNVRNVREFETNFKTQCLSIRTSITAILNYQSTGC